MMNEQNIIEIENITNQILDSITEDDMIDLLYSMVRYSVNNNHCKCNYTARDLFQDVIPESVIEQLFDEH